MLNSGRLTAVFPIQAGNVWSIFVLTILLIYCDLLLTSHNYNQSKFNLICAILPHFNGPLFSILKTPQFTDRGWNIVSIRQCDILSITCLLLHNYQNLYPLNIFQVPTVPMDQKWVKPVMRPRSTCINICYLLKIAFA